MPSQPAEVWREIPEFPNYYASTLGRIRRDEKLQTAAQWDWRSQAGCSSKDWVYARLRMDINHKDGHKQNNELGNLEYVTSAENQKHAYRIGLKRGQRKLAKETAEQVRSLYEAGGWTQRQRTQRFEVGVKCIWNVLNGRTWPKERAFAAREAA